MYCFFKKVGKYHHCWRAVPNDSQRNMRWEGYGNKTRNEKTSMVSKIMKKNITTVWGTGPNDSQPVHCWEWSKIKAKYRISNVFQTTNYIFYHCLGGATIDLGDWEWFERLETNIMMIWIRDRNVTSLIFGNWIGWVGNRWESESASP